MYMWSSSLCYICKKKIDVRKHNRRALKRRGMRKLTDLPTYQEGMFVAHCLIYETSTFSTSLDATISAFHAATVTMFY